MHGEHDLVLHRPLVPGEELASYSEAWACADRAGSGVMLRIEMRDASDRVVAEQWWQTFLVGVALGEPGP